MMEERPTCCRRFRRIRAQGRRRTASLEISIASQRAKNRTFSTSCVRCNKESKPVTRVDENRRGFFVRLGEAWLLQRLPDQPSQLADHSAPEAEHADHEDHALHDRHPGADLGEVVL